MTAEKKLTQMVRSAGCSAKWGPRDLANVVNQMPSFADNHVLVGMQQYDDAGVYCLDAHRTLIQTVDFFTPMVDDPYLFGQIAAANALSDIYAMGARPITAMNIVCFPLCENHDLLQQILIGGADKVKEAGCVLLGGHTVDDLEPKYGLAVTGSANVQRIIRNSTAQCGDLLFLTKRLGNGIINTGYKLGDGNLDIWQPVWQEMASLNREASLAMQKAKAHAATDITGFGLLGHLQELCAASGLGAEIWAGQVPIWPFALQLAKDGVLPRGLAQNKAYLQNAVQFAADVPEALQDIFYDPQTNGGLLIAVPKCRGPQMEVFLESAGLPFAIIGILKEEPGIVVLKE